MLSLNVRHNLFPKFIWYLPIYFIKFIFGKVIFPQDIIVTLLHYNKGCKIVIWALQTKYNFTMPGFWDNTCILKYICKNFFLLYLGGSFCPNNNMAEHQCRSRCLLRKLQIMFFLGRKVPTNKLKLEFYLRYNWLKSCLILHPERRNVKNTCPQTGINLALPGHSLLFKRMSLCACIH